MRVALVTGGGSGIGAATARALRAAGWEVAVCGRRADRLAEAAGGCGALPVVADVSRPEELTAAVDAVLARWGRLDGLVANAATSGGGAVLDTTPEEWQRVIGANLTGAFLTVRAALAPLLDAHGSVVVVASVASHVAPPASAAYAASKAGLLGLVRSLAVDYGPSGLRANAVCPGWTRSEMADREVAQLDPASLDAAYGTATALAPMRRPADAGEVADVVAWLLSPQASYVTGAAIDVDGGLGAVDAGAVAFTHQLRLLGSERTELSGGGDGGRTRGAPG